MIIIKPQSERYIIKVIISKTEKPDGELTTFHCNLILSLIVSCNLCSLKCEEMKRSYFSDYFRTGETYWTPGCGRKSPMN